MGLLDIWNDWKKKQGILKTLVLIYKQWHKILILLIEIKLIEIEM